VVPPAAVAMAVAVAAMAVAVVTEVAAEAVVTPVVAKVGAMAVVAMAGANGAPVPAAGKIAATGELGTQAVAIRSRPAVPGGGAAAARITAVTTAAPRPEDHRFAKRGPGRRPGVQ